MSSPSSPLQQIVAYSQHRAYAVFRTSGYTSGPPPPPTSIISSLAVDTLKLTMLAANWLLVAPVQATGYIGFPFAFMGGLTGPYALWQGIVWWLWDPAHQLPPPGIWTWIDGITYPVARVFTDPDLATMLQNVCDAMAINGWECFIDGQNVIFQAVSLLGTTGNGFSLNGNGGTTLGSYTTGGGGWIMQSRAELNISGLGDLSGETLGANYAYWTMQISTAPFWEGGVIHTDGGDVMRLYAVPVGPTGGPGPIACLFAIGNWMCIANDTNLFCFVLGGTDPADLNLGNDTFWFVTPWIQPAGQYFPQFSAFIATGQVGQSHFPVYLWIDNDFAIGEWGQSTAPGVGGRLQGGCTLESYRYPFNSGEVYTENGQSLLSPAVVAMGTQPNGQCRMIGYIGDAFIDSHFSAPYAMAAEPTTSLAMGITTICRAVAALDTGNNTVDTLWLFSGEPNAGQTGSNGGNGNGGGPSGPGPGGGNNPPDNNLNVAPNPLIIKVAVNSSALGTVVASSPSATAITISAGLIGPPWMIITFQSGTQVTVGQSQIIQVTVSPTGIVPGVYHGTLTVTPVGSTPIAVDVEADVYAGQSGPGAKSGFCSTYGPSVIWVSGDFFDSSMAGNPIVIAGNSYVVVGTVTATALSVRPNPPIQTNVPYST